MTYRLFFFIPMVLWKREAAGQTGYAKQASRLDQFSVLANSRLCTLCPKKIIILEFVHEQNRFEKQKGN